MERFPTHYEQLPYLKKIEGQLCGIQKMIEENRYCVDILTQLYSVIGAIHRVSDNIFKKHLEGCVTSALKGESVLEKQKKIKEIIDLVKMKR